MLKQSDTVPPSVTEEVAAKGDKEVEEEESYYSEGEESEWEEEEEEQEEGAIVENEGRPDKVLSGSRDKSDGKKEEANKVQMVD